MAKFTLCADFQKSLSVASSQDVEIKEQSFATRLRRGHFREAEMQLVSLGPSFRDLGFRQGFPIIERNFFAPCGCMGRFPYADPNSVSTQTNGRFAVIMSSGAYLSSAPVAIFHLLIAAATTLFRGLSSSFPLFVPPARQTTT